jgi:hypothetical protein
LNSRYGGRSQPHHLLENITTMEHNHNLQILLSMSHRPDPIHLVNKVTVFVGGLLLIGLMGYVADRIYKFSTRDRSATNILVTDTTNSNVKTTKVGLGSFEIVEGTPYLLAPIITEQESDRGYYSKETVSPTNYLILNVKDKSAIRLAPKNNALFIQARKIGQNNKDGKLVKTLGIWYAVVKADTDGNKRLTPEDRQTIAMSDVSGANYTEVIPKVDRLLNTFQINQTNLLMIYESEGKNFATELDLSQQKAIDTKELPAIN